MLPAGVCRQVLLGGVAEHLKVQLVQPEQARPLTLRQLGEVLERLGVAGDAGAVGRGVDPLVDVGNEVGEAVGVQDELRVLVEGLRLADRVVVHGAEGTSARRKLREKNCCYN